MSVPTAIAATRKDGLKLRGIGCLKTEIRVGNSMSWTVSFILA